MDAAPGNDPRVVTQIEPRPDHHKAGDPLETSRQVDHRDDHLQIWEARRGGDNPTVSDSELGRPADTGPRRMRLGGLVIRWPSAGRSRGPAVDRGDFQVTRTA